MTGLLAGMEDVLCAGLRDCADVFPAMETRLITIAMRRNRAKLPVVRVLFMTIALRNGDVLFMMYSRVQDHASACDDHGS